MSTKTTRFHEAVMEKFYKVAREKDRSLTPWDDYPQLFLWDRLIEEVTEASEADQRGLQDEMLDIAAFAMFIWIKLEGEKA